MRADRAASSTETYTLTLPYDFEPLTDYLIDIHAVAKGAPGERNRPGAPDRLHHIALRRRRGAGELHRPGAGRAPRRARSRPRSSALPDRPTGAQVDEAFQAAGLAVPQVPVLPAGRRCCGPRTPSPQPVAVVLESSEPLWRSRDRPDRDRRPGRIRPIRATPTGRRGPPTG